jgi:hypothetical protein
VPADVLNYAITDAIVRFNPDHWLEGPFWKGEPILTRAGMGFPQYDARRPIRVKPERPPSLLLGLLRWEARLRAALPTVRDEPASEAEANRADPFQESARRDFEPLAPNDSEG